jgi:hypothetical protein
LYGYSMLCCMRSTGIRGRQPNEHGLLRARDVELNCSKADNAMHPQCFCLVRAKWPDDRWWTLLMLERQQAVRYSWPRSRPGSGVSISLPMKVRCHGDLPFMQITIITDITMHTQITITIARIPDICWLLARLYNLLSIQLPF